MAETNPPPLPAPLAGRAAAWRLASLILLVLDQMLLAWFLLMEVRSIPKFLDIFSGMGAALPGLTRNVLRIPPIMYFTVVLQVAGALLLKEFSRNKRLTLVINAACTLLILAGILLIEAALRLPLQSLIQNVQGQ